MNINLTIIKKNLLDILQFSKVFWGIAISFFLISLYQSFTSPSFYSIKAELVKNDYESAPTQSDNSISSLARLVGGSSGSSQFFQVIRRVHSMQVASMMEEAGYMDIYFNSEMIGESKKYPRDIKLSQRLSAFILGYNIDPFLSTRDLRDVLRSKIKISMNREQTDIFISTLDTDPKLGEKLLYDVIGFTDQSFRIERLNYSLNQKKHFNEVLEKSNSLAIKEQYIDQLVQIESKLASLQSNLPYVVKYVDEIQISNTPVTPNVTKIFLINFVYTLIIYLAYASYILYSPSIIEKWKKA